MDAFFDNKANVLNAKIRVTRDDSVIYTVKTTFSLRGRKVTILEDGNPSPGRPAVVGYIHWKDKKFEIYGHRRAISDIKRTEGRFLRKTHHWGWLSERKEYEIKYDQASWKATLNHNMVIAARFSIPFRPHLFSSPEPTLLHLTKTALEDDEVFLILAFIYSEVRRQDRTNSSSVNGGVGW